MYGYRRLRYISPFPEQSEWPRDYRLRNIARGIKGDNYLVLETEAAGNHPWLPYPGQLRLQAISHIANGACMVEYWHWHSIHNAIESYWKGVLSHDLRPNRLYKECSVIGNELKNTDTGWSI